MTNNPALTRKLYLPVLIFFALTEGPVLVFASRLQGAGLDSNVLLAGNGILAGATLLSLWLFRRAISHPSTHGFLRNTYSGLLLKLFICLLAVFLYALKMGSNLNKQAVFACILIYIIYSILEMRSLLRWNKERKNA